MSTERLEQTTHGIVGKTISEPGQTRFVTTSVRAESPQARRA
jgi:hypothetical protein